MQTIVTECFDTETVERLTTIKGATLRQWETRGIYTCELRTTAEIEAIAFRAPETPGRREQAVEILKKLERGWRIYTIGDLIRLCVLKELLSAGANAKDAGAAVSILPVWEFSNPQSYPSGIELLKLRCTERDAEKASDDYLFVAPGRDLHSEGNALTLRFKYGNLQDAERSIKKLRLLDGGAALLINVTAIMRRVLTFLESPEARDLGL